MAGEEDKLACSLYISPLVHPIDHSLRINLQKAISDSKPAENWNLHQTSCGLVVTFKLETDADKFIEYSNLSDILQRPIQVTKFSKRDLCYRQSVVLRDVPWTLPSEDLNAALIKQGIISPIIERHKQNIQIQVTNSADYEKLIREGLDFFGISRFTASPTLRQKYTNIYWSRLAPNALNNQNTSVPSIFRNSPQMNDDSAQSSERSILQCYRCQGFWHTAANCRHLPRCVRCGEHHSVEFCPRPRNNPICCHCLGHHHAGFRRCPVRLQLLNSSPISITLSTDRVIIKQRSSSAGNVTGIGPQDHRRK